MPIFDANDLKQDVKQRMIAFTDTYLQLKKTVQRAHLQGAVFDGTDPELDAIRDIVVDFEFHFGNNGTNSGRTPAQRAGVLEDYGIFEIL